MFNSHVFTFTNIYQNNTKPHTSDTMVAVDRRLSIKGEYDEISCRPASTGASMGCPGAIDAVPLVKGWLATGGGMNWRSVIGAKGRSARNCVRR